MTNFTEITEFPESWVDIVHCTYHHDYSSIDKTNINYTPRSDKSRSGRKLLVLAIIIDGDIISFGTLFFVVFL